MGYSRNAVKMIVVEALSPWRILQCTSVLRTECASALAADAVARRQIAG